MGKDSEEKGLESGLTLRVLVLGLLSMPIGIAATILVMYYGGKPWTYCGFFLPPVYILLLNELLGRKLSGSELTILMVPFYIMTGIGFIVTGTANEGLPLHWLNMFPSTVYMSWEEPFKTAIGGLIPQFMVPSTETAIRQAMYGITPGEVIDWSAWFTPVTYWSVLWIICGGLLPTCWVFLLRKPLIEDERLPYPASVPLSTLITSFSEDGAEKKRQLFDLKSTFGRVFWSFFVLGLLLGIWPIFTEIIPILPIGAWWGDIPLDFTGFTASVMPGAMFYGHIELAAFILMLLMPYDILVSMLFGWFVMSVLYPYIGVQAGILPYEVGVEIAANEYYGMRPPIPYRAAAMSGIMLGIGAITIVGSWPYIKRAFSSISSGKEVDQGVSLRTIALAIVALNVVLLAILLGSGTAVLPALVLLVTWQIWQISMTRYVGEGGPFYSTAMADVSWPWLWGAGLTTNAWTDAIPTTSSSLFVTMNLNSSMSWYGLRFSETGFFSAHLFKIAEETRTMARDMLIALVVFGIVGIVCNNILTPLIIVRAGGMNVFLPGYHYRAWASNVFMSGFDPGYTLDLHMGATVGGFIFALILYLARMRFAPLRYFTNPVGLMISFAWTQYAWIQVALALAIKYITRRVGGVRAEQVGIRPAVTGFATGFGIFFLFGGLYLLALVAWPLYMSSYVP